MENHSKNKNRQKVSTDTIFFFLVCAKTILQFTLFSIRILLETKINYNSPNVFELQIRTKWRLFLRLFFVHIFISVVVVVVIVVGGDGRSFMLYSFSIFLRNREHFVMVFFPAQTNNPSLCQPNEFFVISSNFPNLPSKTESRIQF